MGAQTEGSLGDGKEALFELALEGRVLFFPVENNITGRTL